MVRKMSNLRLFVAIALLWLWFRHRLQQERQRAMMYLRAMREGMRDEGT